MRENLFRLGLYLLFAGFALAFVAALLPALAAALGAGGQPVGVSGAGCVLVMFVPICFGAGEWALPLMVSAAAIAAVLVVLSLVLLRQLRGAS